MHTLLEGLRLSRAPAKPAAPGAPAETLRLYRDKLSGSRSEAREETVDDFAVLWAELGTEARDDEVLEVRGRHVVFRPVRVTDADASQRAAFARLYEYWQAHDTVELLDIDLSDATPAAVAAVASRVTAAQVARGIKIWTTLPCRIDTVRVFEPDGHAVLRWLARRAVRTLLPRKVGSKTHFLPRA